MSELSTRPMRLEDVPHIVDYWINASREDLDRMGADPCKIPPREEFQCGLLKLCGTQVQEVTTFYLVWLVDGEAIGFSSLKNIVHGEQGEMHLHMWSVAARGKGYGAVLFCLSALGFYRRFSLKTIVCEPSVSNAMPNRMLQKVGFPLVRTYVGASSELSVVCELNCYQIDRHVAERYLAELSRQTPNLSSTVVVDDF